MGPVHKGMKFNLLNKTAVPPLFFVFFYLLCLFVLFYYPEVGPSNVWGTWNAGTGTQVCLHTLEPRSAYKA